MEAKPALFEERAIRRTYDEATEIGCFSVVGIVRVLTQQPDYQTARKYWNKLKERLSPVGRLLARTRSQTKAPTITGRGLFV